MRHWLTFERCDHEALGCILAVLSPLFTTKTPTART